LKSHFHASEITENDGFRFDWNDGWIHLRAAMTEPIIRMIVEWRTKEEAEEKALQVRSLLERLVG
jgi:phosphomannomutase